MHRRSELIAAAAVGVATTAAAYRWLSWQSVRRLTNGNHAILSRKEQAMVRLLSEAGYGYLFTHWPPPGVRDELKLRMLRCASSRIAAADVEDARLELLQPPVAAKKPHTIEQHGDARVDPYYWLRDDERKDSEVIAHLQRENDYVKQVLADTDALQSTIFGEMRGRIQEADQSAPVREGPYFYYSRTLENKQYSVHCRRKVPASMGPPTELDTMDEMVPEEVLLDENVEAEKHAFFMVHGFSTSPDHKLLAYGADTTGNESYTLFVKDIATGKQLLKQPIENTAGNVVWANDNKTLFYVTKDSLHRPDKVWRYNIADDSTQSTLVYHEKDEAFNVYIARSRSDKMLYIGSGSAITSDFRFLSADNPTGDWKLVIERKNDVEYSVTDRGDHFFITIRDQQRPNSEFLAAPISAPHNMTVLLPHRSDVKLESVVISAHHAAAFERKQGLQVATVFELPRDGSMPHTLAAGTAIEWDEPAYELSPGGQGDFDSDVLRVIYTSLTTPTSTIDVNMRTGKRATKKVQPVLGSFESSNYVTERLWATAADGVRVPISLVYNRHVYAQDGQHALLLDGYGSYEIPNDPYFSSARLSLIDRGFAFAIAHVRGGGEMGRQWYEDGKFEKKQNTFTDFIACAEHLIVQRYTSPHRLCIQGRSAGGLTMGAVLNMRPDLFNAAIMGVPFVDVLTTMLDETIPLTVGEWDEWGNPKASKSVYDIIKTYSPVDNIRAQPYPHILITGGLHDPRVGYWEPAKFCCKLRKTKTDANLLLFKCDLGAGHFSQSGRFDKLKEVAVEYAFLLKCQHMLDVQPFSGASAQKS